MLLKAPTFRASYNEDGLFTNHNCSFILEKKFISAYKKHMDTGSSQNWDMRWRIHLLLWASSVAKNIEGDFVECGSYLGGSALAIADFIAFETLDKKFYLSDTYTGLPEKIKKRHKYNNNDYFKQVSDTFSHYKNIELVKGLLPNSLNQVSIEK